MSNLKRAGIGLAAIVLLGALSAGAAAQGRRGNAMMGAVAGQADTVTLSGSVTAVNMAAGQRFPSFTLLTEQGEVTVMAGPYWVWAQKNIQIKEGDQVTVQAFQSLQQENTYVATEVTTSQDTILLRGAGGMGPGRGRGFGRRMGAGACFLQGSANVDLAGKTTLTGEVEAVSMGLGQGFPNFTLKAGGRSITIVMSPYRALQQSGFQISAGDKVSVEAWPSLQYEGAYIAGEVTNSTTDKTITLRDENGIPIGGRGPRGGRRW